MLVTEDGMVTDIRPEHPQKAPCARTGGGEQPASKLERAIVLRLHGAGRAWLYAAMLACCVPHRPSRRLATTSLQRGGPQRGGLQRGGSSTP